ncbi:MAG: hypothetical protein JST86_17420 [Bacteroidetes bacterium]|nr:hypothetical protein [Bacteroidota bacterium]
MSEDLISSNFAENIEQSLISKNLILVKAAGYLVVIYAILNILDWYVAVEKSFAYELRTPHSFYTYRIQPFVSVALTVMGVFIIVYIKKGNALIKNSFEEKDADIFNQGYVYFGKSSALNVIAHVIGILSICIRLFLKQ